MAHVSADTKSEGKDRGQRTQDEEKRIPKKPGHQSWQGNLEKEIEILSCPHSKSLPPLSTVSRVQSFPTCSIRGMDQMLPHAPPALIFHGSQVFTELGETYRSYVLL